MYVGLIPVSWARVGRGGCESVEEFGAVGWESLRMDIVCRRVQRRGEMGSAGRVRGSLDGGKGLESKRVLGGCEKIKELSHFRAGERGRIS